MGDVHIYQNMLGRTITTITRQGDDELVFGFSDGAMARMYHSQDCCESVEIAEIIGDLDDLIGNPLLQCEAVEQEGAEPKPEYPDSWTWTFYKMATVKGGVTIRWLGESNGYYSESVDFNLYEATQ